MKPTTHASRPKDWIPFTNFAFVDQIPESIKLRDHLLPYQRLDLDDGYICGLYGTVSANQGLFLANAFAASHGKMALTVQGWYRVDNFDLVKSRIDLAVVEDSGFINLDRLKTSFRDEIREVVAAYAAKTIDNWNRLATDELSLNELILKFPSLVKAIFEVSDKITLVVHPVHQSFGPDDRKVLTAATMKMIKERVMAVQVRYLEDRVKVEF